MHLQNVDNNTWIAATKSGKELTLKTERIEGVADMHIIEKQEKTCKNVSEMHPVDGFTCSECGISLEDYSEKEVDEESGDITYREYMLRYCPNCGAKVVEV